MEKPPYTFQDITYFSIGDVEKRDPRIDYISRLNIEIGSSIPNGRYTLSLIKPFPPLGKEGKYLNDLKSLRYDDIESISAFRSSNCEKNARIEIQMKSPGSTIFIKCKRIEGIPVWNEK